MDFFRKAGRRFEETKKAFLEGGDVEYACLECEEAVTENYDECPYCGADSVVSVE